jgi:DHA1 family bicyclomycin/chloramphenicol resistance-like MFS transporter
MQSDLPSNKRAVILILGALDTIAPLTIDMYLPAFAGMATDFGTSTARVSLSLTSYFIGLGVGQIIYGPFLDRYGRHNPVYIGMFIYILSCFGCVWSSSVEMLIGFRFMQAMGGAVSAVAVRAMVRDYFTVEESPKIFSMLMLILSVSPLLAPSLGGIITQWLSWHWVFIILAVIVTIIMIMMRRFLPVRHVPDPSVSLAIGPMLDTYRKILQNRQFLTFTLASSFALGGLFIYLAGSTVILQERFQVTPQFYAILFALQSVGLIVGNQLNIFFLKRYNSQRLFVAAVTIQLVSALVYFAGSIFDWYGVYTTICFFFVLLLCLGMTFPNGAAAALAPFNNNLGSASSLMGFLQTCLGGLMSAAVGLFDAHGSLPVALMLFACAFGAWGVTMIGFNANTANAKVTVP